MSAVVIPEIRQCAWEKCGKSFFAMVRSQIYCSTRCRKKKGRTTDSAREARNRYGRTEKGREGKRRYARSNLGIQSNHRYRKSDKHRQTDKNWRTQYMQSDRYKNSRALYARSEKGRAAKRRWEQKEREASPEKCRKRWRDTATRYHRKTSIDLLHSYQQKGELTKCQSQNLVNKLRRDLNRGTLSPTEVILLLRKQFHILQPASELTRRNKQQQ